MADPFAPPGEAPPRRQRNDPASEDHGARDDRPEPARPGAFWLLAALGIGLLCLGRLLLFFVVIDDLPGDQVAPALFAVFGSVALAVGLALAAVLQRGLTVPWRIALLLGSGYFATQGGSLGALALFSGFF